MVGPGDRRLRRRAVLGLAMGGLVGLTGGCDSGTPSTSSTPPSRADGPESATPSPTSTPDRELLLALSSAVEQQRADLRIVRRRRPRDRRVAGRLIRLHGAQLEVMAPLVGEGSVGFFAGLPADGLTATEAALLDAFDEAVDTADDGPLARILACLAAGQAVGLRSVDPTWLAPATALAVAPAAELDVLQQALAVEHAAVHVLGVLGGRTSASERPRLLRDLTDSYAAHRDRRDALVASIRDLGAVPVAAEPGYVVPGPPTTPEDIAAAAAQLESAAAEQYATLVATASAGSRGWAAAVITDAALRAVAFGAAPTTCPGAPELG